MIFLDATTKSIEVVLSVTVANNQCPVVACYDDVDTESVLAGSSDTATNNATAVTAVAAPGSGKQRHVKFLSVYNADTAPVLLTVQLNDNSTLRVIKKLVLAPGDNLTYSSECGWTCVDMNGFTKFTAQVYALRDFSSFRHAGGSSLERWYVGGMVVSKLITTGAPSANNLRAIPFVSPHRGGTLDRLAIQITSGVAGNFRLGLYQNVEPMGSENLYPGKLLADSGSISTSGTGVQSYTLSQALQPVSLYWLVLLNSAAPTINCLPVDAVSFMLGVNSGLGLAMNWGLLLSFAYAALPDPFSAGAVDQTTTPIPAIGYRFSA
jgi:hypothetical protein